MEKLLDFNDIIFENKNKKFGAYLLRKLYDQNILFAFLIATTLLSAGLLAPSIYNFLIGEEKELELIEKKIEIEIMKLKMEEVLPLPAAPQVSVPNVSTIKFLPPEVTKDNEVKEDENVPTQEDFKNSVASDATVKADSGSGNGYIAPTTSTGGQSGTGEFVAKSKSASFPLGDLKQFLQSHLKYPAKAKRMEIEGNVTVGFTVSPEGDIIEPKVIKSLDPECDKEALRVVSLMPKWEPAIYNGFHIKQNQNVTIVFTLDEDE